MYVCAVNFEIHSENYVATHIVVRCWKCFKDIVCAQRQRTRKCSSEWTHVSKHTTRTLLCNCASDRFVHVHQCFGKGYVPAGQWILTFSLAIFVHDAAAHWLRPKIKFSCYVLFVFFLCVGIFPLRNNISLQLVFMLNSMRKNSYSTLDRHSASLHFKR